MKSRRKHPQRQQINAFCEKCDLRYLIGSPTANTYFTWRIEISSVVNGITFHKIKFNRIADNARDAILRGEEWA